MTKVWRDSVTYRVLAVERVGKMVKVGLGAEPEPDESDWGKDVDLIEMVLPVATMGGLKEGKLVKVAVEVEEEKRPLWREVLSEW